MDREKGQEERCPSGAKMRQTFEWLSVLLISSTCFKNKQKKHIKRVVLVFVMQLREGFRKKKKKKCGIFHNLTGGGAKIG